MQVGQVLIRFFQIGGGIRELSCLQRNLKRVGSGGQSPQDMLLWSKVGSSFYRARNDDTPGCGLCFGLDVCQSFFRAISFSLGNFYGGLELFQD